MFRYILSTIVCCVFAVPLFAADTGAMIYVKGQARVNGGSVPNASAIFPGDIVQTETDAAANINMLGSNIVIAPASIVIFDGSALHLDRGGMTVETSKAITIHVGDVTIVPSHSSMTQFEISDNGGTIHIAAVKGDLSVSDSSGTTELKEGSQTTRADPGDGNKDRALAGGKGPLIPREGYEAAGIGVAGGLIAYFLSQDHTPVSPIKP
jgi:hypothetical protein